MMHKGIEWFLWGLCMGMGMGMGWAISQNVLTFIGQFLHGHA
jgi:hypothetical protein